MTADIDLVSDLLCGCGEPEMVRAALRDFLRAVNSPFYDKDDPFGDQRSARLMAAAQGSDLAFWLMANWLDSIDALDHGTILPGWLTPKGLALLDALSELSQDET